jgi:trk system potassium uptake protein TrkH
LLALGFAATILVGSLLLTLPFSNREGIVTPYITALFTATSAVCVTGLVVVDTKSYWTPFGQAIILLLIQVGGLGFMTSSTMLLLLIGRRFSLRERIWLKESHGVSPLGGILRLTRRVLMVTAIIEGISATILFLRFLREYPWDWALWMGVFHAVSAFNNAGFDVIGGFRSLTIYNRDPVVVLDIAFTIILGGLSFTAIIDTVRVRRFRSLLLDTKVVLVTTGGLLVCGTLGLLAMEYANPNTLGPMDLPSKLLNAFFSAVTPRTAGFNTIDVGKMTEQGLLLTIALMFIGAASGSTGGGIKVNTFAVLTAAVVSSIRGRAAATAFGRELPQDHVYRALTVALLSLGLVFSVTLMLTIVEPFNALRLLFETTSAFGTVGLSTGITPDLSIVGKLLITATMYVGRVGPLTLGLALAQREQPVRHSYPEGQLKIG